MTMRRYIRIVEGRLDELDLRAGSPPPPTTKPPVPRRWDEPDQTGAWWILGDRKVKDPVLQSALIHYPRPEMVRQQPAAFGTTIEELDAFRASEAQQGRLGNTDLKFVLSRGWAHVQYVELTHLMVYADAQHIAAVMQAVWKMFPVLQIMNIGVTIDYDAAIQGNRRVETFSQQQYPGFGGAYNAAMQWIEANIDNEPRKQWIRNARPEGEIIKGSFSPDDRFSLKVYYETITPSDDGDWPDEERGEEDELDDLNLWELMWQFRHYDVNKRDKFDSTEWWETSADEDFRTGATTTKHLFVKVNGNDLTKEQRREINYMIEHRYSVPEEWYGEEP